MQIQPNQIKHIHTILPQMYKQDRELKQLLVVQFTEDDSKTSTKDLTSLQADELIYFLKTGNAITYTKYAFFDKDSQQHNYILSLCHQLGWVQKDNPARACLETLGKWIKHYGYMHKPLKEYTAKELPKLVTQLERIK